MKPFIKIAAFVAAVLVSSLSQASAIYNYSYKFDDGTKVDGSFTGTASGNLITGLSNISLNFNGVAVNNSGYLYGPHVDAVTNNWVSGGAVASFDGLENNFLFIDSDYPSDIIYSAYFSIYSTYPDSAQADNGSSSPYESVNRTWQVTTVPEPTSIALLGLGMLAIGVARCRKPA